jgi:hypothetical protein
MRAIVPFQVAAVTSAASARLKRALTVASGRSVSAVLDDVTTTPATTVDQKKATR